MNPNPNKLHTSEDSGSCSIDAATTRRSGPSEGTEADQPKAATHATNGDMQIEKPSRAGQIGEGSYEGTDGYAKSIGSYLRGADVEKDAEAAAPGSPREARELLEAEADAASHTKAPGK